MFQEKWFTWEEGLTLGWGEWFQVSE